MSFYDLEKAERMILVGEISRKLSAAFRGNDNALISQFFSDTDTYIRKTAYLAVGKLFLKEKTLRQIVLKTLIQLLDHENYKVRQTVINAAGEIGKIHFEIVNAEILVQAENLKFGSVKVK